MLCGIAAALWMMGRGITRGSLVKAMTTAMGVGAWAREGVMCSGIAWKRRRATLDAARRRFMTTGVNPFNDDDPIQAVTTPRDLNPALDCP